jgi:3-deoxy-D-manno-octulosonic-acid transferase
LLQQADALILIINADQLAEQVIKLFNDPELRQRYGTRAHQVVMQERGALQRHLDQIQRFIR